MPVVVILLSMLMVGPVAGVLWSYAPAILRATGMDANDKVYTVAMLHTNLRRDPVPWVGRIVRVRGVADYCLSWVLLDGDHQNVCSSRQSILKDPEDTRGGTRLPLRLEAESRLDATLRRVPFIAPLLPAAQEPWWGIAKIYTVQLRPASGTVCWNASPCVVAILIDTDPSTLL